MIPGAIWTGFDEGTVLTPTGMVAAVLAASNGKLVHCVLPDDATLVGGLVATLPARIGPDLVELAVTTRHRTVVDLQGRKSILGTSPTSVQRLGTDTPVGFKEIVTIARPDPLPAATSSYVLFASSLPSGLFFQQISVGTSAWSATADAYIQQRYRDNLTADTAPVSDRLCAYRVKLVDGYTYSRPRVLSAVAAASNFRGWLSGMFLFDPQLTDPEAAAVQAIFKTYWTLAA